MFFLFWYTWLAFFPQLSVPSKSKKNHGQRKKQVIEAYHIMERKALKMGAPSIRTARAAWSDKTGVTRGTIAAASFSMRWKRWRPGRFNMGSSWKGKMWGVQENMFVLLVRLFYLFALVRIGSQNLPVKIGRSLFFGGDIKVQSDQHESDAWKFQGTVNTSIQAIDSSRLKKSEEKTSLAPYRYHNFQNTTF